MSLLRPPRLVLLTGSIPCFCLQHICPQPCHLQGAHSRDTASLNLVLEAFGDATCQQSQLQEGTKARCATTPGLPGSSLTPFKEPPETDLLGGSVDSCSCHGGPFPLGLGSLSHDPVCHKTHVKVTFSRTEAFREGILPAYYAVSLHCEEFLSWGLDSDMFQPVRK